MAAISADGAASIRKEIVHKFPTYCPPNSVPDESTFFDVFEIHRTVEWIISKSFKRVRVLFLPIRIIIVCFS